MVLPLDRTSEVISLQRGDICPIPGVAASLLGVVNQRGKLLWVLDLSDLLALPAFTTSPGLQDQLTLVVLADTAPTVGQMAVGQSERQLGCVVSALKGILPLEPDQFRGLPQKLSAASKAFLSGMAVIEKSPAAVLNVDAVLAAL
ncbi:chemotaxis protein CheW [Neosynechococcus sphagnicola]|nr:chemotaxis protein CheW [Neosynechococcus sphagnicola]